MAAAIALILVSTLVLWLVIPKQSGQELFTSQYKPYPAPSDTLAPATEPELAREFLKEQDAPSSPAAEAHSKKELSQENVQERIPPSPSIPAEETTPGRLKDADLAVDTKEKESRTVQQELSKSENSADANKAVAGAPESVQRSEQAEAVAEDEPQATAFSARSKTTLPAASSAKSNEPARTSFQLGMLAYKNEKYENAIRYFEMKDNPPEASFFAGVSYLSLENPHLAIQKLDAYLAGEHTSYQEAAWWYKALSLIKTGDKQAARTCLARVVTFKGEFEQKATRLLRKM
ncbi:MAG: hypothetical protein JNL88_08185 [Bacteroidia bacterium]|nr:hypothetical protein [Bacteroidia bacterium]